MEKQGAHFITATKIRGRAKPVPSDAGYLPIFPNKWHGHAFGYTQNGGGDFSALSPMRLGPVPLPSGEGTLALNIENYYQFAKVFPNELSDEPCDCGSATLGPHNKPGPAFYKARAAAYADKTPHRHKQKGVKPAYSCYTISGADGIREVHCDYIESRYYYCTQMETLAKRTPAWTRLYDLYWRDNLALEIFGYDAYTPSGTDADSLYAHYCDPARPFGHEMVLLTMVALGDQADLYPWNRRGGEPRDAKKQKK